MKRLLKVGFASLCALSFLASSPKNVQTQSSIDSNIVEKKAPRIRIPNSKPICLGDKLTLTTHRGNVIWYVFNPTETGVYVVDTYSKETFPTMYELYANFRFAGTASPAKNTYSPCIFSPTGSQ